jgi:ATP-dependent Clp endopeptidase proteolytic subunit ClpP
MSKPDLLARRREALAKARAGGRWFKIENKAGPVAEIRIYDEIWFLGITAEDIARELDEITASEILVAINSPGGDVFDAIAIYNLLRAHSATVTTRVDGIAASAASVIAQAGAKRQMMSSAQMMIHEPWGIAVGPASEHREFADLLDRQTDVLAGIYAQRSGREVKYFADLLREGKDVWMTDAEAVAEGLADEVIEAAGEDAGAQAAARTKLIDEVAEAVDAVRSATTSAERVAALRAEKGKQLSGVARASLDELVGAADRLRALLDEPGDDSSSDDEVRGGLEREYARFVQITQGV